MSCSLCTLSVDKSGSLRPNCATFDCGHEFHLSCILKYSKENISMSCPTCNENDLRSINLGDDRTVALQSLIDARRAYVGDKTTGFLSWFSEKSIKSMVRGGTSLDSLKLKGIAPEDLIEERIDWDTVSKVYKTSALIEFGFLWHHMITMGFQPDHFKLLDWQQMSHLQLTAIDMLKTSITIRQLAELKIDIAHLHELGFRLKELKQIGGNCETMKLLTSDLGDLKTYFNPTTADWDNLGFTKENIEKYGWQTEEYTPVRKMRHISLVRGKSGFMF